MAGKKISPKALAQQWLTLPSKFEVNVLNFEVLAGRVAVNVFRESFYLRRFNTAGSMAWLPRKDKRRHPLLIETGTMGRSIVSKPFLRSKKRGVKIYTDSSKYTGSNRNKKNICYAAIHNEGGGIADPGSDASFIAQRQFMGHSTILEDRLDNLSMRIFDGFPKCL